MEVQYKYPKRDATKYGSKFIDSALNKIIEKSKFSSTVTLDIEIKNVKNLKEHHFTIIHSL